MTTIDMKANEMGAYEADIDGMQEMTFGEVAALPQQLRDRYGEAHGVRFVRREDGRLALIGLVGHVRSTEAFVT